MRRGTATGYALVKRQESVFSDPIVLAVEWLLMADCCRPP